MTNLQTTHKPHSNSILNAKLYDVETGHFTEEVYNQIRRYHRELGYSLVESAEIVETFANLQKKRAEKELEAQDNVEEQPKEDAPQVEEKPQVIWKVRGTGEGKQMVIRYKDGTKKTIGCKGRDNKIKYYSITRHGLNNWSCTCKANQIERARANNEGRAPKACKHMKKCFVEYRQGTMPLSINLGEVIKMS